MTDHEDDRYWSGCQDGEHEWGAIETSRWSAEPHRKCAFCRHILIDFPDDDE